jgi:four helix bundle protein
MDEYLSYEKLLVWQKAIDWAVDVINMSDSINCDRKHFRIIEQLESSSSSVAMNIAEGKGRFSKKEFRQYLYISRGSLYETLTLLYIIKKKNWITETDYYKLRKNGLELNKMLNSLQYTISKSIGDRD